jgi:hypothetical protein
VSNMTATATRTSVHQGSTRLAPLPVRDGNPDDLHEQLDSALVVRDDVTGLPIIAVVSAPDGVHVSTWDAEGEWIKQAVAPYPDPAAYGVTPARAWTEDGARGTD